MLSSLKSNNDSTNSDSNKQVLGDETIESSGHPTPKRKPVIFALTVLALFLAVYFSFRYFKKLPGDGMVTDKSIAVLPFADMSPGKDHEYFSDGLSEELLNMLAKVPELKVIARTSAFSFKGKNEDIRSIAKKLGVAHILEGSVRKKGNKIRVTAQLIRAEDGVHLWSDTYDRQFEGIFQLQDEIAAAVVNQLKVALFRTPPASVSENKEVYDLTLQAKYFLSKARRGNAIKNFKKSLDFYNKALAIDSLDARALAGVGEVYCWLVINGELPSHEGYEKAREAATKSIMLDANLAAGHYGLGFVRILDWGIGSEQRLNLRRY